MTKRLFIAGTVVLLVLGGLGVFHFILKPALIKEFISKNVPPPANVAAEAARTQTWIPRITSVGTLIAIQGIDVAPQVAGVVTAIQFESGQTVQKGAQLVKLDDDIEQADLASNKATLRDAILEFQRQEDLRGRGVATEAKLEEARAKRDSAVAAVQRTRAIIDKKTIVAPFAGKLGLRKVEMGQYVSPGTPLVSLQALEPMRVDFPIPENQIDLLRPGQRIEVEVNAFPGETFTGMIETPDARVSQETRTLTVRGRLSNPEGKLLPGMFAAVRVLAGEPAELVTIPRTAVSYGLYGDSIYVVKAPGGKPVEGEGPFTVERRFVRTGEVRGDRVAIREGVKAGETVVTSGQLKLRPGASIRINNSAPLTPQPSRPRP